MSNSPKIPISIDDIVQTTKEMKLKEAFFDMILDQAEEVIISSRQRKETLPYFNLFEYDKNKWLLTVIDRRYPPSFRSKGCIYYIEGDQLMFRKYSE